MDAERLTILKSEVHAQISEIESIYNKLEDRRKEKGKVGLESIGYQLHNLYCAFEDLFKIVAESFENHIPAMDLFHLDYMVSHIAARGFAQKLVGMDIRAILPQHGSLISTKHVPSAIDYLRTLRCGLDIIYAGMK